MPPDWEYLAGDCPGGSPEGSGQCLLTAVVQGGGVKGGQRGRFPSLLLGQPRPVPYHPDPLYKPKETEAKGKLPTHFVLPHLA